MWPHKKAWWLVSQLLLGGMLLAACGGGVQAQGERGAETSPVVVVFWSSWCRGCQANLVELERVGRHLAAGGGQLRLVGVNLDGSEEEMARAVGRLGLRVAQISDPEGELAAQWEVTSLPQVLVVQGGQILFRGEGTALDWSRVWRRWVWCGGISSKAGR